MKEIQRGFRGKIGDFFDISKEFTVTVSVSGSSNYDSCCFGIDSKDKLSDERFMIFYNQTSSPNREIVLSGSGANTSYTINLSKLPSHIQKLVFTVSIDGSGVMRKIRSLVVALGGNLLRLNLRGSDFQNEKAVITVELYKKDVWRLAVVARGFDGGLSALLKHFGGVEELPPPLPPPPPVPQEKVSLEKRLEREAPQLVSLAKPLTDSLKKHNLVGVVAQVALLIDISGSMRRMFQNGIVQGVINKIVPLAMEFDDNGEFELWFFGSRTQRMPAVTVKNYAQTTVDWRDIMNNCGGGTDLAPAIRDVVEEYRRDTLPAYVLCITDGATSNAIQVKKMISDASIHSIFWQFVGIGRGNYGILEELDTMTGRTVDNANFFALDDIEHISNAKLYSRMLTEFPDWLSKAKRLGILK